MKIVLLGPDGQVGWQLRRSLAPLGEVLALAREAGGDLRYPDVLAAAVEAARPDVVVNAAAYTAVDAAEDDPDTAFAVNARAPEVLAATTARLGAWLVHYSTDYVYDGSGEAPWRETDPPGPLGVYGRSKLAGDEAVARLNPRHLVFRTSWVFDSRGRNFMCTILEAAAGRDELAVVDDQWGAPTPARLVAEVTANALRRLRSQGGPAPAGLFHVAPAGTTNWHQYARLVVQEGLAHGLPLRVRPQQVRPVPTTAWPTRARRPLNSRLDTTRLRETFGDVLPPWQDGVRETVAELAQARLRPS